MLIPSAFYRSNAHWLSWWKADPLKYSQGSCSFHLIRCKMSGIQINIEAMEMNFQETLTQSSKGNISEISLDQKNGNSSVSQGSKKIQSVLPKPSSFLLTIMHVILSSGHPGGFSRWRLKNGITICTSLSWKPFAFVPLLASPALCGASAQSCWGLEWSGQGSCPEGELQQVRDQLKLGRKQNTVIPIRR